jgi:hypothetical protein
MKKVILPHQKPNADVGVKAHRNDLRADCMLFGTDEMKLIETERDA